MLNTVTQANLLQDLHRFVSDFFAFGPIAEQGVANHQRSHHVFQQREFRQQVVKLKDEAKYMVSQLIASRLIQVVDAFAFQQHFAVVR